MESSVDAPKTNQIVIFTVADGSVIEDRVVG